MTNQEVKTFIISNLLSKVMSFKITSAEEFYEVLNSFPHLEEQIKDLDIDPSSIEEEKSIHEILEGKNMSDFEIDMVVKKLNQNIQDFLSSDNDAVLEEKVEDLAPEDASTSNFDSELGLEIISHKKEEE